MSELRAASTKVHIQKLSRIFKVLPRFLIVWTERRLMMLIKDYLRCEFGFFKMVCFCGRCRFFNNHLCLINTGLCYFLWSWHQQYNDVQPSEESLGKTVRGSGRKQNVMSLYMLHQWCVGYLTYEVMYFFKSIYGPEINIYVLHMPSDVVLSCNMLKSWSGSFQGNIAQKAINNHTNIIFDSLCTE